MKAIFRAFALLNAGERRQLAYLIPGIVLSAILKVISIAALAPFLQAVMHPDSVLEEPLLLRAYVWSGAASTADFLYLLGLAVLVLLVLSNGVAMLIDWLLLRYSWLRNHSISQRLLDTYLAQPYSFILTHNSSDLSKDMLSEAQAVVQGIIAPALQALSNAVTALFVIILLLIMDPLLALVVTAMFVSLYVGIYYLVRQRMGRLGVERVEANRLRFVAAAEAFGAFKEIKLLDTGGRASSRYAEASLRYSERMATSEVVSQTPRFALETVAFGALILVVLLLLRSGSEIVQVVPLLGVYAFAAYRLMPALQQIYQATSKSHFNLAAVDSVSRELDRDIPPPPPVSRKEAPLPFDERIDFENVSFNYPGSEIAVLDDVSLNIEAGTAVALVGTTGSGKTTLVDLTLGLVGPTSGRILIDGKELAPHNHKRWQARIGYVQQHIFLADDTIANNIAFGRDDGEADMDRVLQAARTAQLYHFVTDELPGGFDTVIGEKGVRLSGGQRQRIGIARALYSDPDVLILDEATSALDGVTESKILQGLSSAHATRTIIMVTHRVTTAKQCDHIFVLEHGRIVDHGKYQDLLLSSSTFRHLAQVTESGAPVHTASN